ncbi:F-box protein [Dorcoceras hygrometricum]|uniref:F-box protein n=1 Tax=Dorcoceras hygrometricum TaxID=472368 RepID=A0A2Z7D2I1_9LAMI|nr:F-box protein [Dorcoceras hygrometricum]
MQQRPIFLARGGVKRPGFSRVAAHHRASNGAMRPAGMRDKRACNRAAVARPARDRGRPSRGQRAMVSRTMRDASRRMSMRCACKGAALQAAEIGQKKNFLLLMRSEIQRKSHFPKSSSRAQHIELSITDSACKNQLVVVSVQYGPFNPYIPIRSTTIGKSRVAIDPTAMHTSWRSNSDIASVTRVAMTFRVVRTNQYNQDLELIHSTNGNHLESPKEGSSIDHQVTIYLHAQNITMFPTNETWYFALQILVSNSGGLILILTAQSTRFDRSPDTSLELGRPYPHFDGPID